MWNWGLKFMGKKCRLYYLFSPKEKCEESQSLLDIQRDVVRAVQLFHHNGERIVSDSVE